jgi:hypothetical protein
MLNPSQRIEGLASVLGFWIGRKGALIGTLGQAVAQHGAPLQRVRRGELR